MGAVNAIAMGALETVVETVFCGREPYEATHKPAPDSPTVVRLKLLSWLVRLLRNAVFKQSLTESAGPRRNELVLPKLSRARAGHIAASLLYTIVAAPLFAIKGSLQSAIKDQLFPVLFEGFQWTEYNLEELSHADGPITYGGSLDFTDITRGFRAGIHTDVKVAALKQLRTKLLSCLRHLLATCAAEVPSYAMEIHHLVHRSVLLQMTKYLEVTRVTLQSDPAQPVLPSLAQLLAAPTRDQGASPQATIDSIGDVLSAVQHMTSLEQQQPASLFQCFLLFDCYFSGSPVVNTLFQTIASAASRVIKEPQRMMDSDGNSSVASSHEGYLDEGRVAAILAHSSTALQQAACQFFHAVLTGLQRRFNSLEVDGSMIEAWHGREGEVPTAITQKTALLQGCMLFNQKPAKGVKHWQAAGLLPEPTDPAAVAYFLRNVPFLLPERVGEMLGAGDGEQHTLLRRHFVSQFDFEGTPILDCLRMFLQSFRLPGEAQQIDRILQTFAESAHFQCAESSLLPSVDTTYLLSFALIMLNTDIHNPNIKPERKMSKEAFVRNNRDYGDEVSHGVKLTDAFLSSLYTSIANEEIAQPTAFDGLLPLYEGVFGLNRSSTNPDCEDRFLMPLYNDSLWHDLRQRHQHRTNVGAASHAMTAAEAENPTNTEESTRIASADAHTAAGTRLEWLQSTNRLLQQAANVASLPTGASASEHDRPETVELARFYADTAINPAMDTFLTVLVFSPVPADTPESPPSSPDSLFQTTAAGQPASPMHHTSSINEGITMCAEVAAGLGLHNTVNDIVCALFSIGSRAVLQVRDKGTVKQPAKRSTDAELRAGWAACLRQEPVTAQQPGAQSQPRADGLFAQLRRLRPQHTAHMEGLGNSSMAASRTALGMAFRLCDQYSSVLRQSTIHWMLYTLSQLHHIGCLPPNFGLRASLCRHLHPLAFAPRVSGRAVRFLSEHSAGRKGMGQMHSAANDRGQGNGMFGWLASFWGGESRGSNAAPDLGAGGTRHPHGYGALDSCSSGDDDSCSVHTVAIPFSVGPGKPSQTLSARMTISQAMYWSSNPASLSPELRAVLQLATDARLPNWIQRSSSWSDTQLQQFLHHMTVMMGAASTQESAQAVSGGGAALPRASASPMSQESQGRTGATTAFHLAYKIGMIPCPAAPDADSSESFFLLRLLGGVCSANYTRPQLWWSQLRTVFDLMRQRAITTRIVASTVLLHVTHSLLQGGTAPPTASEESPALPPTNLGRMDSANDSAAGPPSQDRHAATLTAIDAVLAIRPSWQAPLAEDYAAICCTLLHALADEQWVDLQWLMQDGRLQRLCRAAAATKRTSTARRLLITVINLIITATVTPAAASSPRRPTIGHVCAAIQGITYLNSGKVINELGAVIAAALCQQFYVQCMGDSPMTQDDASPATEQPSTAPTVSPVTATSEGQDLAQAIVAMAGAAEWRAVAHTAIEAVLLATPENDQRQPSLGRLKAAFDRARTDLQTTDVCIASWMQDWESHGFGGPDMPPSALRPGQVEAMNLLYQALLGRWRTALDVIASANAAAGESGRGLDKPLVQHSAAECLFVASLATKLHVLQLLRDTADAAGSGGGASAPVVLAKGSDIFVLLIRTHEYLSEAQAVLRLDERVVPGEAATGSDTPAHRAMQLLAACLEQVQNLQQQLNA